MGEGQSSESALACQQKRAAHEATVLPESLDQKNSSAAFFSSQRRVEP